MKVDQDRQASGWDPRVIVGMAFFAIVACKNLFTPWELAAFQIATWLIAIRLRIALLPFFWKSMAVLPFALASLPLVFTVPGTALFECFGFHGTKEGIQRMMTILAHCWLCFQVLLLACSSVGALGFIQGMGRLGLPSRLVKMLTLTLRYLDLLQDEAKRMNRARACRSGIHKPSFAQQSRTTGHLVGALFLRTLDRAQRVQLVMDCRGNGQPWASDPPRSAGPSQWVALATVMGLAVRGLISGA